MCVGKICSIKQQIHWRKRVTSLGHIKCSKYTMQIIYSAPLVTCHKESGESDYACRLLFYPS